MAADWEVPGRPGCQGSGTRVYMVQGLFLLFFHTPQPSFSQLCEAGRTDVKQAPLPLPRGRWPGSAAPTCLCISGSRGKQRSNPDARAARPCTRGIPREPDGAHASPRVGRPRAARDAYPGLRQPAPTSHPCGLGRRVWPPRLWRLCTCSPGRLVPTVAGQPCRPRVARVVCREDRVGLQLGGCAGRRGLGVNPG